MTDKEVIKLAQKLITDFKCESDTMVDFCNTVIKKYEQQPCEDVISREEALKVMCDKCPMYNCVTGCSSYRHIEKMPSVQPQPKRGKWKYVVDKTGHWVWECDDCEWQQRIATNYCPDCGADMRGEKV